MPKTKGVTKKEVHARIYPMPEPIQGGRGRNIKRLKLSQDHNYGLYMCGQMRGQLKWMQERFPQFNNHHAEVLERAISKIEGELNAQYNRALARLEKQNGGEANT